jgi:hypothetical protein
VEARYRRRQPPRSMVPTTQCVLLDAHRMPTDARSGRRDVRPWPGERCGVMVETWTGHEPRS